MDSAQGALQSVPGVVWWITALHLTLLLAYSVLLPTYRSPDEPQHADLAHLFSEESRYPQWDERAIGTDIDASLDMVQFRSGSKHLTADQAPPKSQRPSFEELEEPSDKSHPNHIAQHPPLYYAIAGGAEHAVELLPGIDNPDFQQEVWFYRLVSALFVAPLPLIVWRVATILRLPPSVGVAASLIPLAIPQFLHIGSSVNNDSLAFLLFWLTTPLVIRIARGQLAPRTMALAGLVVGLGLYTKGYAFFAAGWVLAALLVALLRRQTGLLSALRAGAAFGGVLVASGGWWWIRNLVVFGQLKPSMYRQIQPPPENPQPDVPLWIERWATTTTKRFWGDFGWFDVAIPGPAIAIATGIVLCGLLVCCIRRDRLAGVATPVRLLLAAPLLLLAAGHFSYTLKGHLETGKFGAYQGRYWFGALAAICVASVWGIGQLVRSRLRILPPLALASVVVMQVIGISTILDHYWGAVDSSFADRIRAVVAWAPLPGELLGLGALVGAGVLTATIVAVVSHTLGRRTEDGEPPQGETVTPAPSPDAAVAVL